MWSVCGHFFIIARIGSYCDCIDAIATPSSLPESLSFFDVLLFNLNNQQSPCIPLIESLEFDGDVVAIVERSLPEDLCAPLRGSPWDRLKEKSTDVIVKPVPWSQLKNKPYFLE